MLDKCIFFRQKYRKFAYGFFYIILYEMLPRVTSGRPIAWKETHILENITFFMEKCLFVTMHASQIEADDTHNVSIW